MKEKSFAFDRVICIELIFVNIFTAGFQSVLSISRSIQSLDFRRESFYFLPLVTQILQSICIYV